MSDINNLAYFLQVRTIFDSPLANHFSPAMQSYFYAFRRYVNNPSGFCQVKETFDISMISK